MKRYLVGGAAWLALSISSHPAFAGDTVVYAPAPDWIVPVDFATVADSKEDVVLLDRQRLLDGATSNAYDDLAVRLTTPGAVTQMNTLSLVWRPDKGDLIIHRLEIYRDGKVIDLLAGGSKFTVLRRETRLEKRELDGVLTATLPIEDLRVGDVVRLAKTVTLRDQALGNNVQWADGIVSGEKIGFGRTVISWPSGDTMRWKVIGKADVNGPEKVGDLQRLTIALPAPKPADMPDDAPWRYRLGPLVQATNFDSWNEISATLAPYFQTSGTIEAGSDLAREVDRIANATADPLERTAKALQVVQDQISYLANGMDGGNYIPQKPEDTWRLRFGDCKAKSLLLAAMLERLGVEAQPVAVHSSRGDALQVLLPEPGDFDHMIVRATVDGTAYWLDGTSGGSRLGNLAEVPAFEFALPIVTGGSDLVKLDERWQPKPDRILHLTYDHTAGIDLPTMVDMDSELFGVSAVRMRESANERDPQKRFAAVQDYVSDLFEDAIASEGSITYDPQNAVAHVRAKILYSRDWDNDKGRASISPVLASTNFEFAPDRARSAWRDIPLQLAGPSAYREEVTILLPNGGKGYSLSGLDSFSGVVGGRKIDRTVSLKGDRVMVTDEISSLPTEIAPADFAAERARATTLKSGDPVITAPIDESYYWQLEPAELKRRMASVEDASTKLIKQFPDESWSWSLRSAMRNYGYDMPGALADIDKAIEIEPSSEYYLDRSELRFTVGDLAGAIDDARSAFELAPETEVATRLASLLAQSGSFDDALEVLDQVQVSGDDRIAVLKTRWSVLGEAKRLDEGWDLIVDAIAERPGDADLLNERCWYSATWSYRLDEAADNCTKAVEAAQWSAASLDSRALAYYKLGQKDAALADLEAALRNEPGMAASRYVRGMIRIENGDIQAGRKDVGDAERLYRPIKRTYARYGLKPPA